MKIGEYEIGTNISTVVWSHARFRGEQTAFFIGDRRVTWREFEDRVAALARALLASGLQRGDRVGLLSLNSIEALEIMYGVLRAGGVLVPLSALLTPEILITLLEDCSARYLFVAAPLEGLVRPIADRLAEIPSERRIAVGFVAEGWTEYETFASAPPGETPYVRTRGYDECVIIYSSGTTGTPKGIVHTHHTRTQMALGLAAEFRIHSASTTVIATPLFTNATWATLLPTVGAGGVTVLLPHFDPEAFLAAVSRHRATHVFLVPTQYQVILDHPAFGGADLDTIQIMISMGSALPLPLKKRILEEISPNLMELYGITEGLATILKPEDVLRKTGSVGRPIAGTDIRIVDDEGNELAWGEAGEIVGTSLATMTGYLNRPEATEEAVWLNEHGEPYLRSGDIGRFDEDGFLYILDRKKDMIVSGGSNVFASDIEEVMLQHPEVHEVAVIAVPHPKWIETPLALVRLRPGSRTAAEELKEWVNQRVAKVQRVSAVELRREEFPRNALGKLLKRELREPYWRDAR